MSQSPAPSPAAQSLAATSPAATEEVDSPVKESPSSSRKGTKTKRKYITSAEDYPTNTLGGFFNKPRNPNKKRQLMRWTAENDRKLLLVLMLRNVSPKEHEAIAAQFPEGPSPKSIQERITKLKAEQRNVLHEMGVKLAGDEDVIDVVEEDDDDAYNTDTASNRILAAAGIEEEEEGAEEGKQVPAKAVLTTRGGKKPSASKTSI